MTSVLQLLTCVISHSLFPISTPSEYPVHFPLPPQFLIPMGSSVLTSQMSVTGDCTPTVTPLLCSVFDCFSCTCTLSTPRSSTVSWNISSKPVDHRIPKLSCNFCIFAFAACVMTFGNISHHFVLSHNVEVPKIDDTHNLPMSHGISFL